MNKPQHNDHARLMRLATYASVTTALVLITIKIIAWFISDSVSILATLVDSGLDVLASMINLIAVNHALQPADKEHRFGHGKAEPLAGLAQSMFVAGSGVILLLQAISRLLSPEPVVAGLEFGIGVMAFSMLATLFLVRFQCYVVKQTGSSAIKADALHYKTDLLVNGSVIIALILTFQGWYFFDPVFAVAIALFILYSAWHIVRDAIDLLMDHELPDAERDKICELLRSHPEIHGFHDLRTRRSGTIIFVQLHLELNQNLNLLEAHRIADTLEKEIEDLFVQAEVIIHQDPVELIHAQ